METWSDGRSVDGTVTHGPAAHPAALQRRLRVELLALFLGAPARAQPTSCCATTGAPRRAPRDFETAWETLRGRGLVPAWPRPPRGGPPNYLGAATALIGAYQPPAAGQLEINFVADYKVFDGRFANIAWLQELPDPITKLTWDNAAC